MPSPLPTAGKTLHRADNEIESKFEHNWPGCVGTG